MGGGAPGEALNEIGLQGTSIRLIKAARGKPGANLTLGGDHAETFPRTRRSATRRSTLTAVSPNRPASPAIASRKKEHGNGIYMGKKEVRLSLRADDTT